MYKFCRIICIILFRIFYRVSVIGEIDLPKDTGYMICSNHIHFLDPVFIGSFTKRQISFMGKKELFDKPILEWLFKKLGAFPVDRGKGDLQALRVSIEVLKSNHVLSIFPEGTRSKDGFMGEFKTGAALIAIKAGVPIIPVKIEGNYKIFSKMTLKIGEPIYSVGKNKGLLTNELKEIIQSL